MIKEKTDKEEITPLELVQSVFPEITDEKKAISMLWSKTGYPCWFPKGADPIETMKKQLLKLKNTIDSGQTPCDLCSRPADIIEENYRECNNCHKAVCHYQEDCKHCHHKKEECEICKVWGRV